MISPANTYPGLTKKIEGAVEANEPDVYYDGCKRNYTRVVPTDEIQGAAAANWAKQLGATKAYVLDDTELYGHGLAVVFANTAPKVGLQLVGGPEGIDSQGQRLSRAGPEGPPERRRRRLLRRHHPEQRRQAVPGPARARSVPTSS